MNYFLPNWPWFRGKLRALPDEGAF